MSDRSAGDIIGGGVLGTLFLVYLPKIMMAIARGLPKFFGWFFALVFLGLILNIFTGHLEDFKGPVTTDQIEANGYATLDRLSVAVTNNSDHEVNLVEMTCNGHTVYLRRLAPGETRGYARFAGNIPQGGVTCQVDRLKS